MKAAYAECLQRERWREKAHRKTRQGAFESAMVRVDAVPGLTLAGGDMFDPALPLDAGYYLHALQERIAQEPNAELLSFVLRLVLRNGSKGRNASKYALWLKLESLRKRHGRTAEKSPSPAKSDATKTSRAGNRRPPSTTAA